MKRSDHYFIRQEGDTSGLYNKSLLLYSTLRCLAVTGLAENPNALLPRLQYGGNTNNTQLSDFWKGNARGRDWTIPSGGAPSELFLISL
jgi:hypothetical protein